MHQHPSHIPQTYSSSIARHRPLTPQESAAVAHQHYYGSSTGQTPYYTYMVPTTPTATYTTTAVHPSLQQQHQHHQYYSRVTPSYSEPVPVHTVTSIPTGLAVGHRTSGTTGRGAVSTPGHHRRSVSMPEPRTAKRASRPSATIGEYKAEDDVEAPDEAALMKTIRNSIYSWKYRVLSGKIVESEGKAEEVTVPQQRECWKLATMDEGATIHYFKKRYQLCLHSFVFYRTSKEKDWEIFPHVLVNELHNTNVTVVTFESQDKVKDRESRMRIYVKTMHALNSRGFEETSPPPPVSESIQLEYDGTSTINGLKDQIATLGGFNIKGQRIYFGDKSLDDIKPLKYYHIKQSDQLYLKIPIVFTSKKG